MPCFKWSGNYQTRNTWVTCIYVFKYLAYIDDTWWDLQEYQEGFKENIDW